jgi:hypothetical protein
MDEDKRKTDSTIPADQEALLNALQLQVLPGIKYLGWEPRFIRHQVFKAPALVLRNFKDGRLVLLDEDGRLEIQDDLKLRGEEGEAPPPPRNLHYF